MIPINNFIFNIRKKIVLSDKTNQAYNISVRDISLALFLYKKIKHTNLISQSNSETKSLLRRLFASEKVLRLTI